MILANPEARRALRSIVQALVVFTLLALVWWWSERFDQETLRAGMHWALGIVGLGTLGYVMENGLRALKLKAGKDGVEIDAGGDNPAG